MLKGAVVERTCATAAYAAGMTRHVPTALRELREQLAGIRQHVPAKARGSAGALLP